MERVGNVPTVTQRRRRAAQAVGVPVCSRAMLRCEAAPARRKHKHRLAHFPFEQPTCQGQYNFKLPTWLCNEFSSWATQTHAPPNTPLRTDQEEKLPLEDGGNHNSKLPEFLHAEL